MNFDNRLIMAFAETMLLVFCSYIVRDLPDTNAVVTLIGVSTHFISMFTVILGLSYLIHTEVNNSFRSLKSSFFTVIFYFICFMVVKAFII